MPKIDIANMPIGTKTVYPAEFRHVVNGREKQALGNAAGLTQFGVNLTRLKPGAASALRHWHTAEDELIYLLEGELMLVENEGETVLRPGDAAGFKAGIANGHHLVNRSAHDAVFLEVGTRAARDHVEYPDADLVYDKGENGIRLTHKSGEPYPKDG
jgi:uncharacterized cupin superfamily protein